METAIRARQCFSILALLLAACCVAWAAGSEAAAPPTDGLIFYQDFDHQGEALCGQGWACRQEVPADRLVPGRFGQGCRFERPRTNYLSPNQASVEAGTDGFTPGAAVKLAGVAAETRFGARVLRAEAAAPGVLWRTTPVLVRTQAPHRPAKVFLFSAYLRAEREGVKVRLSLNDGREDGDWKAEVAAADKAARKKDPKAVAKPPLETVAVAGEATLGPAWRRVAARLEVDVRRPEQALVGSLEVLDAAPAVVLADGLQLEQACVYPQTNTAPTTWIEGGQDRGRASIDLPARHTGLAGPQGTLACWVRPLPDQCGGTRHVGATVAIGHGWFAPAWQVGGSRWYAGEAPTKQPKGKLTAVAVERRLLEPGRHDGWHHLLLTWDEQEAAGYVDGQLLGKTSLVPGELAPAAILRLGGSFLENAHMTGDLDEVVLYARRLSEPEIAALAGASAALAPRLPPVLLRRPPRIAFLRSEPQARVPLELVGYGSAPGEAAISARVPALNASLEQSVRPGQVAELEIKPWRSEPGRCELTVEVTTGAGMVRATDVLEVFQEPPNPEFIIYAWGGTDPDLEERGFNCLFGEPLSLLRRGLWAIARIDVRDRVPYPWSPENRAKAEPIALQIARGAMAHPNVRACLVNSELSHPPIPANQPWFLDWMKAETGLERVPAEVQQRPMHVRAKSPEEVPAILPEGYPAYKFLRWWAARGQGYYLFNTQLARWMRQAGLKTVYYTDQPEVPSQFEDMDLADFWGYPKSPEGLVARFSHASCIARLAGKPFQAMPGTIYWDDGNGLWLKDAEGNRKVLCLSPDCLKENLWISVACPTASIGLYGIGERRTQLYDKACDAAMTEAYRVIGPVGVLVGGLPAEQEQVALLESDALWFLQPGVASQWTRHFLMRTASRMMARARVGFDWIIDDHVRAGWLNRYRAVVVPGAWALPGATHQALVDYARTGRQVVVDRVMRAEIPGAVRLNIQTQAYPDEAVERELGGWARSVRQTLKTWAAVTPPDSVFTYTREAGPARYLFVINDRRQSGPQYEKWKVNLNAIGLKTTEPLRDQGLPQEVQVSVPAGMALYDVLAHRRLEAAPADGRQRLTVHLEPGGAALIAAFPQPLAKLELIAPERVAPGTEATLSLRVFDASGQPAQGRQLAEVRVTGPDGKPWGGVQHYRRIADGRLVLPLRLPLSAARGTWRVDVLEWTSGLRAASGFVVD